MGMYDKDRVEKYKKYLDSLEKQFKQVKNLLKTMRVEITLLQSELEDLEEAEAEAYHAQFLGEKRS